ncbi:hypothetical protein [Sphingomicrobium nitratireducens]|uniref:hypothetical protein n=1 Tax=Sphingomicrobium nitratireducens TaxID=2964666 RepID=UPI002240CA69|nr:hypothetical protein [Sphingomicrobium nitratireducens]
MLRNGWLAPLLLLVACTDLPGEDESIAYEGPSALTVPGDEAPAPPIPVEFHGRWGASAADCDPANTYMRESITVGPDGFTNHDMKASFDEPRMTSPKRLEARFMIEAQGETWSEVVILTREGDTLLRSRNSPKRETRYVRCD